MQYLILKGYAPFFCYGGLRLVLVVSFFYFLSTRKACSLFLMNGSYFTCFVNKTEGS